MIGIIAANILALISTVDDAEVRGITGTAVGQASAFDADGTAGTHRSRGGSAFCAAEFVVRFGIDAFDGIGRCTVAYIHISCYAFVHAGTIAAAH